MAMARTGTVEGLEADHWLRMATESTGGKEVRTFSLAKWAVNRSQQHQMAMCQPRWDRERLDNMALWKTAVIIGPASVFGFVCIAYDAASGRIAIPILTSAFAAAWSLLQTLDPWDSFDIEGGLVSRRAYEELRTELRAGESPAAAHAGAAAPGAPRIRFEEVGFTYPETDRPVLDGLELEIHPGELVAVVGLNGAGKSTLIKLLSGLYQPCTGRITADGVDISELGAETWSEQLSVIFQDFVRYPLSVAENVALGRAIVPVDTAALKDVARHTGLDKLIATLPNGWDTPLSPSRKGGVDLSGGQWQQILLARALYAFRAGARLLVMDEPTAHLDVRSEMAVFTELAAHRGRASVVLISHRLSTVRQADRIVLLRDGRVTESGTHDALMELRGTYARLFTTQAQRFHQDTDHVSGAYRKESL
jgi:ABC-type multidrug transport system fused ATPase/permease subunit